MNSNRGIFDSLPNQGGASPFTAVNEPSHAPSPFAPAERIDSPFAAVTDEPTSGRQVEPGKPAKLPDRRLGNESPFQIAEVSEGFAYDAPVASASPFAVASPQAGSAPSVFSPAPAPAPASFGGWQQAPAPFQPAPAPAPVPSTFAPPPAPVAEARPAAPAAPAQIPAANPSATVELDCSSIRQIELRAIFGVDHEMTVDEILRRSRGLTGIRHIARIGSHELAVVESVKHMLANLGFGTGGLKIAVGSVPIEFIREGNVLLAVQTDGGFAPGVRETLMLVARELGRTA